MSPVEYKKVVVLLTTVFCVTFVKPLDKQSKESKMVEVEEIFDEIDENHQKLKQVFEDVVLEAETGDKGCLCVPYYLCNTTAGEIIRHGQTLLQTRLALDNPCPPTQICCERDSVQVNPRIQSKGIPAAKCGYSYNSNTAQESSKNSDPTETAFAEFPWTVIILRAELTQYVYVCVGSLIHPKVVLTAAHCLNQTDKDLIVRAGEWNRLVKSERLPNQNKYVGEIIKHPKFRQDSLFYNVALLILEKEFVLQENVNTACLANSAPDALITRPRECLTTGWGADKPEGNYSDVMKKIPCSLITHEECQQQFRSTRLGKWFELHQSFICAYSPRDSDVCRGFGGAPLVCPIAEQSRRYQQVGLTSWGLDCAGGDPTVFTKIPQVKDWIDEQFDMLNFSKNYYTY